MPEPEPAQILWVFPAGGQQGTTVQVLFAGPRVPDAQSIVVSGEGVAGTILSIETKENNDNGAKTPWESRRPSPLRSAKAGWRKILCGRRRGTLERVEFPRRTTAGSERGAAERSAGAAQVLPSLPVVINGQLRRLASQKFSAAQYVETPREFFRFKAAAGQNLVFAVDGAASFHTGMMPCRPGLRLRLHSMTRKAAGSRMPTGTGSNRIP